METKLLSLHDVGKRSKKYFSKYKKPLLDIPNLFEGQVESYKWLIKEGIQTVLTEFSPIADYSGKKFEMEFLSFDIEEAKYDEKHSKRNKLTYEAPMKVRVKLIIKL
jgi:DNA-directed RNA polymerase subunit beta